MHANKVTSDPQGFSLLFLFYDSHSNSDRPGHTTFHGFARQTCKLDTIIQFLNGNGSGFREILSTVLKTKIAELLEIKLLAFCQPRKRFLRLV